MQLFFILHFQSMSTLVTQFKLIYQPLLYRYSASDLCKVLLQTRALGTCKLEKHTIINFIKFHQCSTYKLHEFYYKIIKKTKQGHLCCINRFSHRSCKLSQPVNQIMKMNNFYQSQYRMVNQKSNKEKYLQIQAGYLNFKSFTVGPDISEKVKMVIINKMMSTSAVASQTRAVYQTHDFSKTSTLMSHSVKCIEAQLMTLW